MDDDDPLPRVLSPEQVGRVRAMLNARNERSVAALLSVSRQTLSRCLAGLPLRPATVVLIRERLDRLAVASR